MVLGRRDELPEDHPLPATTARARTEHNRLWVGDLKVMETDTMGLLDAGGPIAAANGPQRASSVSGGAGG
ncbi:hypothetical protein ACWDKQ_23835 [Saccharopolyspora sp. NPDC000995]